MNSITDRWTTDRRTDRQTDDRRSKKKTHELSVWHQKMHLNIDLKYLLSMYGIIAVGFLSDAPTFIRISPTLIIILIRSFDVH